jgi:putative solute:sodium symporter small subunit
MNPAQHQRYWQQTRRFTLLLVLLWFCASFGLIFFAADLQEMYFFSWPLPFYAMAQGLLIFFLILNAIYTRYLRHLNQAQQRAERKQ